MPKLLRKKLDICGKENIFHSANHSYYLMLRDSSILHKWACHSSWRWRICFYKKSHHDLCYCDPFNCYSSFNLFYDSRSLFKEWNFHQWNSKKNTREKNKSEFDFKISTHILNKSGMIFIIFFFPIYFFHIYDENFLYF